MSKQVKQKRRWGDRKDGTLVRDLPSLSYITPIIYPNRCDNEAYIAEEIDLTNIYKYLEELNKTETEFPYTVFHLVVCALLKTITLRPKMNRFIANRNVYQRNEVSASFVVKKQFSDTGAEALAFVHSVPQDNLQTVHQAIKEQVFSCRSDKVDKSTSAMDFFTKKLPRFISKFVIDIVRSWDKHGRCPKSLIATDPYYASVILSNVGSLKLNSGYHHLTNWGTTSVFCLIGQIQNKPVFDEKGNATMKPILPLGLTIDERIADGYYYAKTIRLLKHLLQNPQLLQTSLDEEIDY